MIRLFKHYIPRSVLVLWGVDILLLYAADSSGFSIRYAMLGKAFPSLAERWPESLTFILTIYVAMFALGLYRREACRDVKVSFVRLLLVFVLSFPLLSIVFFVYPAVSTWRSIFLISFALAFVGLFAARIAFSRLVDVNVLKQKVLVLGGGPRARRVRQLEQDGLTHEFRVVGFVRMSVEGTEFPDAPLCSELGSLADYARQNNVDEIVTAMEERRGALPVEALLECKLRGFRITDFTTFLERETGQVELDSLNPSWLIYSDGFAGGRRDMLVKRSFDITASLGLLIFSLPVLLVTMVAIKLTSRGPIFYRQERVGQYGKSFMLLKFRSMRVDAETEGTPQWAKHNDPRITSIGQILRVTRIDEFPQIFNVLKGDMSFVGPRPERFYFVEQLAREIPYYPERHYVKPGITGWAQINYPYGASIEDAKCKLQYDLYYVKNCTLFMDILIMIQTARVILFTEGGR